MMTSKTANSALRRRIGGILLEYCPWERAGCEGRGCWPAGLCRAARAAKRPGVWEALWAEGRRGTWIWLALAAAGLGGVIVALAWSGWP